MASLICSVAYAQIEIKDQSEVINYEILRSQINVYSAYLTINEDNKNFLLEADSLAGNGQYEIGMIYLEQVLESLRDLVEIPKSNRINSFNTEMEKSPVSSSALNLSIISGIDFDQHEFEIDYDQSDSKILEEINRPYIGLNTEYVFNTTLKSKFSIYNSIRYDNENLKDDYQILWNSEKLNVTLGGFYSKSFNTVYSSYWEHKIQGSFTSFLSKNYKIFLRENFNYKIFSQSEYTNTDFYRNFFECMGELYLENLTLYNQYNFELNEFLGNNENDYQQHKLKIGYRKFNDWRFKHSMSADVNYREYSLIYSGDEYTNNYIQISLDAEIDFPIYKMLNMRVDEQFIKKIYNDKSTFEPDYIWNFVRPELYLDLVQGLQFGVGYEWEIKSHSEIEEDGVSSTEQNFNSKGLFSTINYFTENGSYLSFSSSYQWRRYPDSPTNDLINLYSNRNILSLMLTGSVSIYNNLRLNVLGMYDNDNDIDSDKERTQSSILNIEIEYSF